MPSLQDLPKARVVIIGDAILDIWHFGHWHKITGEGVPAFLVERTVESPGGAANVAMQVKALGADATLLPGIHTPRKTRYAAQGTVFRADEETIHPLSKTREAAIISALAATSCDVLILSDYAKGTCSPSLCQQAIKWAKANGVKVVVDPKGDDWRKYIGCDVITPNRIESQAALVSECCPLEDFTILETRGAEGMVLWPIASPMVKIPATNANPVDVCGCGDTVTATLAACLAVGYDLPEAAKIANAAAGVVVGKRGTATCSLAELEAALA